MSNPCCCASGAAVSGEEPEFTRRCCPVHRDPSGDLCRHHKREADEAEGLTARLRALYLQRFLRVVVQQQSHANDVGAKARAHYENITRHGFPELENGYRVTLRIQLRAKIEAESARQLAAAYQVLVADSRAADRIKALEAENEQLRENWHRLTEAEDSKKLAIKEAAEQRHRAVTAEAEVENWRSRFIFGR